MRKSFSNLMIILAFFLLAGCATTRTVLPSPTVSSQPDDRTVAPAHTASPTEGLLPGSSSEPSRDLPPIIILTQAPQNSTPAQEAIMTPASAEQSELVRLATQDLAKRLNLPAEDISLVDITNVVWPDGSLGCPQPGMFYTQALVEGARIRLQVGEHIYHYHSGRNQPPFYCENPSDEADQPGIVDK